MSPQAAKSRARVALTFLIAISVSTDIKEKGWLTTLPDPV